ncbi:translation initiation factor IF-2 N-terminal domain-containing protein, partial [Lacrimispora sp. 38-1]|uniref:translation initiation factor IF-2 N-terminal domain-containing protein n=1 Tax=Lacrimispora sp. 38-1 TaxID=3125778 RepID=UPI003CF60D21
MRVYDLAKELGKDTSKEILDILEKHNINLKSSSNITDEQASIVKKEVTGSRGTSPARPEAANSDDSEAPKKKIAAVFRPQNAQMKPQGQGTSRPAQKPAQNTGQRDDMQRTRQGNEHTSEGAVREHSAGNREDRPQGSYQGNREER